MLTQPRDSRDLWWGDRQRDQLTERGHRAVGLTVWPNSSDVEKIDVN